MGRWTLLIKSCFSLLNGSSALCTVLTWVGVVQAGGLPTVLQVGPCMLQVASVVLHAIHKVKRGMYFERTNLEFVKIPSF